MKNRIFQNWLLKLGSVVFSIVIWVMVYNINDPEETKRLYNVPVTLVNTEVLTDNNQVYQVLNGTDVVRTVTLHSTRSVIDSLKESDIKVEADFSKMKMDGTIELRFYSARLNDSISFNASANEIQLEVEEKIDKYLALKMDIVGKPASGYTVGNYSLGINQIKISGPESVVKSIQKAVAVVDISNTSDSIATNAEIVLRDEQGNEISKERLEISARNVIATVDILATKTVPIRYVVAGTPAEGYLTAGEVQTEAVEIVIAGKPNVLTTVTELVVEDETITIEGATEDVRMTVDLDHHMPVGVTRANKEGQGIVELVFPIAKIIDEEIGISPESINITNVPEGYEVNYVTRDTDVAVIVRGADYLFENIEVADIHASIDVGAWLIENNITSLEEDIVYSIIPVYEVGEGLEVITSSAIEISANILED